MSDALAEGDDDASTRLRPEERDALIPSYITTRVELNEAEAVNIREAGRHAANPDLSARRPLATPAD